MLLLANKIKEKIPDSCNAKEHYQSYIYKKEKPKISNTIRNNYLSTKNIEAKIINQKPKYCWYQIKLTTTIRQAEKVSSNSSLYSDTKKIKHFLNEKKYVNITKRAHAFKGFGSPYNVEILDSFNPELQLKETFAVKNKLKKHWFSA